MRSKEFRKLVMKKYGRHNNSDVLYVNFLLTEKHALVEIAGIEEISHKAINGILNQYQLGHWNLIKTRGELNEYFYWFEGQRIDSSGIIVRSFYKTDREHALEVLGQE